MSLILLHRPALNRRRPEVNRRRHALSRMYIVVNRWRPELNRRPPEFNRRLLVCHRSSPRLLEPVLTDLVLTTGEAKSDPRTSAGFHANSVA